MRRLEPHRVSGDAWESVALHVYIARVGPTTPTRATADFGASVDATDARNVMAQNVGLSLRISRSSFWEYEKGHSLRGKMRPITDFKFLQLGLQFDESMPTSLDRAIFAKRLFTKVSRPGDIGIAI